MKPFLVFLLFLVSYISAQSINGVPVTMTGVPESSITSLVSDLASKQATLSAASGSQNGYLLSTDWATFNNKQNALGFTPENTANKGIANGYPSLDSGALLPASFLPNPSATTPGGIKSITSATHQWLTYLDTSGVLHQSRPACGDLSDSVASCNTDATNAANISAGTLPAGRLPAPTSTTLGGIQSIISVSHNWITYIDTSGVPHQSQPAASDVAFTQTGSHATATTQGARNNDTVNLRTDYGADNTGSTDATTIIANAISDLITSGKKSLYIPAGTYKISGATGNLFALTNAAPGLEIYGDGPGLTILQYVANQTLTGTLNVFTINGWNQSIHDLSILNGAGMSGSYNWTAIAINQGAFNSHLYNFECAGAYGSGTAGGGCVTTFQVWSNTMSSTTMGAGYSSGSQTVTPGSMAFIYKGQRLNIGGSNPEAVAVTAVTSTTFTATFANAHLTADTITNNSQGYQGAVIENFYIHDSYLATGIVLNSSSNVVKGGRIINVGSDSTQHGIYIQGGTNRIEHNYIEGVSGIGIQGYFAVSEEDGSGTVIDGNTIVNYGTYCILVQAAETSDGTNPEVPSGTQLARYHRITNNSCRQRINSGGSGIIAGIFIDAPAAVSGNLLEDACGSTSSCLWMYNSGSFANAIMSDNVFTELNDTATNQYGLDLGVPFSVSSHNIFNNWNNRAIYLNAANVISQGDIVNGLATGTNTTCAVINANNVEVSGMRCTSDSLGVSVSQAVTGVRVHDSTFTMQSASQKGVNASTMQGVISDIQIFTGYLNYGAADPSATLIIRNIDGVVGWNGTQGSGVSSPSMGRLIAFPASTNVITQSRAVIMSSGLLATATTSSTTFIGYALTGKNSTSGSIYIAGQPGTEVSSWATDGAWAIGDYGILSTSTAGELHDNGASPPSSGSYVIFLNTGGSAGNAWVLVVKTL